MSDRLRAIQARRQGCITQLLSEVEETVALSDDDREVVYNALGEAWRSGGIDAATNIGKAFEPTKMTWGQRIWEGFILGSLMLALYFVTHHNALLAIFSFVIFLLTFTFTFIVRIERVPSK